MAPVHRLRRRATVEVAELRDEPVLLLRQGFGTWEIFDSACSVARVLPRVLVEAGDAHSLIALAEAGRGVAIVPSTVRFTGHAVHVLPVLQAGASLGTWGWVLWDRRRFMPAYAQGFLDELLERVGRRYPGREFDRRAPPVPRPG